ncbi:hypothetical protein CRM22_010429 [Opisthorchis felineus]|uniref:Major facilitator superfamily (MFS) profile domain-containing protein n=1 Tax=Opisthorchis felineus TaxID=147828 RepID=A0A4S2KYQ3_OPIFE|nr:hypothetical protein CRM22_010429 [Opisthorchis felineus]
MLKNRGITPTLVLAVCMTCLGSSFLIGYNLAVLNLPAHYVKSFLSETILHMDLETAEQTTKLIKPSFLYAQLSTVFVVAAAIGAGVCGSLAESFGRRNALLFNHLFAIAGAAISGPSTITRQPALIFVGRFFSGINSGVTIGTASLYLTEIAPRDVRGAIGACHQLAVTLGIMVAYLATMGMALNTEKLWPIAIILSAVPAIVSLIVLPICPESPRLLFIEKGRELEARESFVRFNNKESVDAFIDELREEIQAAKSKPKFSFIQLFKRRDLRMPVLISCLIQVLQQLSGINAVISYSSTMFKTAGLSDQYNEYCVLAIGVFNVLMTCVSVVLLEKKGRRTLLLWPTLVVAVSLALLTITVNLVTHLKEGVTAQTMGGLSVVLLFFYVSGFALGLGPVPALIVAEIFRQGPRAAAYSLSQTVQWLSNLLVLCSYPSINDAIGGYSFLPFLVVVIALWIFFFLFMPETQNRTFDHIARDLSSGSIIIGRRTSDLQAPSVPLFSKTKEVGFCLE